MEFGNFKSEILNKHKELINPTYEKLLKEQKIQNVPEVNYSLTSDILIQEWKKLYSIFVLNPIEENVINLFHKVQTKEFEKEKGINVEIEIFEIYYNTAQYFYLFVLPHGVNQKYEEFPRFEIKTNDENLILHSIFREIWFELYPDFSDIKYYDLVGQNLKEFDMLYDFLSNCWLETKKITNSNVTAILSESTGSGSTVYLNGSMKKFKH